MGAKVQKFLRLPKVFAKKCAVPVSQAGNCWKQTGQTYGFGRFNIRLPMSRTNASDNSKDSEIPLNGRVQPICTKGAAYLHY